MSNEGMEIDIWSQNEEANEFVDEPYTGLPNIKYKPLKKYKKSKKKIQFASKKVGTFQREWLKIYSWLIYNATKNLMFCSLCQAHKKQNRFGKEGNNIYLK